MLLAGFSHPCLSHAATKNAYLSAGFRRSRGPYRLFQVGQSHVAKADSDMKAAGAATSDAADNVAQATGTAARTAGDRARDAAATAADRAGGALETAGDKVRQGANGVGDHDSRTDRDSSDR